MLWYAELKSGAATSSEGCDARLLTNTNFANETPARLNHSSHKRKPQFVSLL